MSYNRVPFLIICLPHPQFLWTAPPRGSGCINFKAMVEERMDIWYSDYGSLTYSLCEDDSPLAEPPVS